MDSPEHRKRAALEYFVSQAPDENVVHLERVASERVFASEYDVWDVHTDLGRWWVISEPMNLYTQNDFKSMDVALSFHIGLTQRVFARFRPPGQDREAERFAKTWRRIEQAHEAFIAADEAEEFQAVGMRCRECLLSFARELATDQMMEDETDTPKTSDFKGWTALVARRIEPRERPRSYLRASAAGVWDYVAWLTHAQNATRHDALEAIGGTVEVLHRYALAVVRWERGEPERCPECGSYRLDTDTRWTVDDELASVILCEVCGWEVATPEEGVTDLTKAEEREASPPPEGDCITSDQISTYMTPQDFIDRHS